MLKSDSWAVQIVAALLAIGCATAARGQVSVRERLQVTGVEPMPIIPTSNHRK